MLHGVSCWGGSLYCTIMAVDRLPWGRRYVGEDPVLNAVLAVVVLLVLSPFSTRANGNLSGLTYCACEAG